MPRLTTVRPTCSVRPLYMTRLKAQSMRVAEVKLPLQHHCWPACPSIGLQCTERLGHLRMCIEPDWRSFGDSTATAAADLTLLVRQVRCWHKPEEPLQIHEAVCLARGATAILRAVHNAGGASTLAAAEPGMTVCLGYSLVHAVGTSRRHWVPNNVRQCVELAFAVLGPQCLQGAAEELLQGMLGSPQHACITVSLTCVFMQTHGKIAVEDTAENTALVQFAEHQALVCGRYQVQEIAAGCVSLLRAIATALSEWSAAARRAIQQQQSGSNQRHAQLLPAACELRASSVWLPTAAGRLLCCMKEHQLCDEVDPQQLLAVLGDLLRRVVVCMELGERAAAAGVWRPASSLPAATCVGQLHAVVTAMRSTADAAARAAAGLAALHAACTKALGFALAHLVDLRHAGLLLYLLMLASCTLGDAAHVKLGCGLLSQLACVQQRATSWVNSSAEDAELPPDGTAASLPVIVELLPICDQLALLVDHTTFKLATLVKSILTYLGDHLDMVGIICVFDTGAVSALSGSLQMAPCKNVRALCSGLMPENISTYHAPGLFSAVGALAKASQVAMAAAAACKPWAAEAIEVHVCGGIDAFWLGHAEAAAQEAAAPETCRAGQLDASMPHTVWTAAAAILREAGAGVTPPVARALARRGAVWPLLRTLPWQTSYVRRVDDGMAAWSVTGTGIMAVGRILMAVLDADPTVCTAVLRHGSCSWDVVVRHLRCVQPPPCQARTWSAVREALAQKVAAVLEGKGGGGGRAQGGGAAADADAVAAAERAMQELLAEEQPAEASGQHSKAAIKRARKKAAKQRAVDVGPDGVATSGAAQHATAASCLGHVIPIEQSSPPAAGNPQPAAAAVELAAACTPSDVSRADRPPLQPLAAACTPSDVSRAERPPLRPLAAAAGHPAAHADWWRCPLSGKVMHDPVLIGSEGHSFEREALEEWLAAHPGVDPLSRQPLLPPWGKTMLANHTLRNMIQQLSL